MASFQQPLTAQPIAFAPRITVQLKPHACQEQQKDSNYMTELVKSTDPGHGLKNNIAPLVTSQPLDVIAEKVALAAKLDPTYEPVDFSQWYKVEFNPEECKYLDDNKTEGSTGALDMLHQHAKALFDHDDVVCAHLEGACAPPPVVNWQDDPRSANQGYLEPAPKGIDVKYAWGLPGGDGLGTNFVDIERGWDLDHEDLVAAGIKLVPEGHGIIREEDKSHGTSVLGQIVMVDNKLGGIGIAPSAKARVISSWRKSSSGQWYTTDMVNALLDASTVLQAGDVVLIEAQEYDPTKPIDNSAGQKGLLPVEVLDATFSAVRTLTALGITVVEAGCNGEVDLDAYVHTDGKKIFNRTAPGFRDSGAILVGAAESATRKRSWYSNYGSRIDVFAWGDSIDTTDYQTANPNAKNLYTAGFGGTSGASPIVTGATLILQGLAAASKLPKLKPLQVRQVLAIGGTASQNPASDKIGVMPNLKAIIDGKGIAKAQAAAK